MKLYFETNSGISGDMTVAALLDLGADERVLMKALDSMKSEEFKINISRVKKSGLDCLDFDVVLAEDNHDHDMEYLYGHTHEHSHEHEHDHSHHEHHHSHRGMKEINEILDRIDMTPGARHITDRVFDILAEAEAKAHGVAKDQVHFHEVGAIDSIVDIVSAAVCLDNLGADEVIVPKLFDGKGSVRCQHGILPVPVPAVANIIAEYGIPLELLEVKGELVTPTGAAFIAAVTTSRQLPKEFTIKRIGLGAGKRETGLAGFLRVMEIVGTEE